tara:strand:- start:238 stop:507 length:270 start_codon:yes stop_codon:yes gene_type:complete
MMHGIARKTVDTAGGIQLNGGQDFVHVEGNLWVLLGDPVQGHGVDEHAAPVMAEGSGFIRINDIPVCREGHLASCGHASTGSSVMRISD